MNLMKNKLKRALFKTISTCGCVCVYVCVCVEKAFKEKNKGHLSLKWKGRTQKICAVYLKK